MSAAVPYDRRDAAHPQRMMLLLGVLPVAAIVVFALGIAFGVRGDDIPMLALAVLTAVFSFIPLILDQGRRASQRHVLLSVFALVYLAFFVVPAFLIYLPAEGPIDASSMAYTNLMPGDVVDGQLVALLGLLSLLAGYGVPVGRAVSRMLPRQTQNWSLQTTLLVAAFMIPLGWLIQGMAVAGVLPASLGSGVVSTLGSALIYGNVLLAYALMRYRSRLAFLALCVTIPLTSALGFFTGSKTAVLIAPLMVVLTSIILRRRIRARWILLGVVGLALLYPASVFFRRVVLVDNTLTAVDALASPGATLSRVSSFVSGNQPYEYFLEGLDATGVRLDGLGPTSVVVRDTPSRVPYQYGRTLALFFAAFVPRLLWPDKPEITIGRWITDTYGSGPDIESSTAVTTLGDYYLNFGIAGAIAGMMLLGIIFRITHESLLRGEPTAPGLLAAVVILYQLTLRFEGNVASQYSGAVFALIPILAAHLVIRTLAPPARPRAGTATQPVAADARLGI